MAIFNFTDRPVEKTLPLRRLGLSESINYLAMELWSHDTLNVNGAINVAIPARDVKVFRIEK